MSSDLQKVEKSSDIVKANMLVQSSYSLTLNETRLILQALEQIKRGTVISADTVFTVNAKDFAKAYGVDEKSTYDYLVEIAKKLYERSIFFSIPSGEGKKKLPYTQTRWVSFITYHEGEGCVKFSFSQFIIPYISNLEREYTKFSLAAVAKMNSAYAMRIYEICAQWRKVGKLTITLVELKYRLGLSDEYSLYKEFKRRVLLPSLESINENSDLQVVYEEHKKGRSVESIVFHIGEKNALSTEKTVEPNAVESADTTRKRSPSSLSLIDFMVLNDDEKEAIVKSYVMSPNAPKYYAMTLRDKGIKSLLGDANFLKDLVEFIEV